jgi:hypothetical protein
MILMHHINHIKAVGVCIGTSLCGRLTRECADVLGDIRVVNENLPHFGGMSVGGP